MQCKLFTICKHFESVWKAFPCKLLNIKAFKSEALMSEWILGY